MKYIPKLQNGKTIVQMSDNTRVASKQAYTFPKLNNEQAFNYSAFGTLNSPNNSHNFIQGYKKTPQQQSLSNAELGRVERLENIQKQKIQEVKNLRHAAEVAPYIIPGLGQAMWLGKGVDLATNRVSEGKYKSWGDMINKNTGSGEFVGEFTNPGYYAGVFPKLIGKGLQSAGKYTLKKAEPYLLGDKRIPMMSYKPKSSVVGYENPNFPRDFEIDDAIAAVKRPTALQNPINHPKIENLLSTDEIQTWADNYGHYANAKTINKALVKTYGDKYSYVNIDRMLNNNQIDDNLAYNMLYNAMKKHSNNFNGWITKAEYDLLPRNKSGFTEDELKKILGNKKLSKSINFEKTLVKPNNKIILHQENTPINSTEMPMEIYLDIFNKNLPKLNKIIEKNNKSGIPYKVERLENGRLHFNSELGDASFGVTVNPGKFKGKVLDVGDENYYENLPGLNMTNTTSSVFGDNIPRSGSGAYKSINEYLKLLKLGRVKPGFNSQTVYSRGLWKDAILKNKAVGFFKNPGTLVGSMKSITPAIGKNSELVRPITPTFWEDMYNATKQGIIESREVISNPVVQNTIRKNIETYKRLKPQAVVNENLGEIMQDLSKRKIHPKFTELDDVTSGQLVDNGGEAVDGYFNTQPWNALKPLQHHEATGFHEGLHIGRFGSYPIARDKVNRLYKPNSEWVNKDNASYILDNISGEGVVNTYEMGKRAGLKIGQSYPGIDKFKEMLQNINFGEKTEFAKMLKLDTPRDYKRVWDAMTGKYFVAPIALTTGYKITQNKKE